MPHAVAFYGTTRYKKKVQVTYKQRFWKRRSDGVRQRYRKTVTGYRYKNVKGGERLTVYGTPKQIKRVKRKIDREEWIPKKQYVDRVSAEIFLQHPRKYARKGVWDVFNENESP
jgi:hypothetical protein